MLVAISGSQGSGKTSITNKLRDQGYPIIERKTSRSILQQWDVTLEEVNNNAELTTKFQEEIIERKYNDEKHAINSQDIYFTERSYADLFTYALVSLGKDNRFDQWLQDYYKQCMWYQQTYNQLFYLKAGHFNVQSDGVRGQNVHYSRMVDLVMADFTQQMTNPNDLVIVDTPDLDQRLAMITIHSQAKANR